MRADDFTAFERTGELLQQLEAFERGDETHSSLARWASSGWRVQGAQGGPIALNRTATRILTNVTQAGALGRADQQPILRADDARSYIELLQRGEGRKLTRLLGSATTPLEQLQRRLRLPTEREVVPGLGWAEYLRFASPATGRSFLLEEALQRASSEDDGAHGTFSTEDHGDASDCLTDLLETLGIDLADSAWRAPEFERIKLAEWVLWRQDDNGSKTAMCTFTGCRKAQTALAQYESLHHKQTYWLESRA